MQLSLKQPILTTLLDLVIWSLIYTWTWRKTCLLSIRLLPILSSGKSLRISCILPRVLINWVPLILSGLLRDWDGLGTILPVRRIFLRLPLWSLSWLSSEPLLMSSIARIWCLWVTWCWLNKKKIRPGFSWLKKLCREKSQHFSSRELNKFGNKNP